MNPIAVAALAGLIVGAVCVAIILYAALSIAFMRFKAWRVRVARDKFTKRHEALLREAAVTITPAGLAELRNYDVVTEWKLWPFPHVEASLTRDAPAAISLAALIPALSKAAALNVETVKRCMREIAAGNAANNTDEAKQLAVKIFALLRGNEWIKEELRQLSKNDSGATESSLASALALLRRVCHTNLLRHRQALAQHARERMRYNLDELRDKVLEIQLRDCVADHLRNAECDDRSLLPPGTIFAKSYKDMRLFVIQEKPQCRTIRVAEEYFTRMHITHKDQKTSFRLAFPYVIFLVGMRVNAAGEGTYGYYAYAFVAPRPIQTLNDQLFKFPLSNVHADGKICLGNAPSHHDQPGKVAGEILSYFWNSVFNGELEDPVSKPNYMTSGPKFGDLWTWEAKSAENPLFMADAPLIPIPSAINLRFAMDDLLHRAFGAPTTQIARAMEPITSAAARLCEDQVNDFCVQVENEWPDNDSVELAAQTLAEQLALSQNEWAALVARYLDRAIGKINADAAVLLKKEIERNEDAQRSEN